jgi:hypothetical protein
MRIVLAPLATCKTSAHKVLPAQITKKEQAEFQYARALVAAAFVRVGMQTYSGQCRGITFKNVPPVATRASSHVFYCGKKCPKKGLKVRTRKMCGKVASY